MDILPYYFLIPLGFGICVWIELLSPAFMSYRTSLPSLMILSLACGLLLRVMVFHLS
jgi:hypothetical protein